MLREHCGCVYCEFLMRMERALHQGERLEFYCKSEDDKLSDPFEQVAYMDELSTVTMTKSYAWN